MDLISLIVTLIIISLFGIGIMLALIIMSQEKEEKEIEYEKEAEIQYIREYLQKKEQKRQARKQFFNNLKNKLKKFLLGGREVEDINQLELLAYIIVISKEITKHSEKTIDNYIDLLEEEILKTPKNVILIKANTKLHDKIVPRHKLNLEECINYAKLIFHCLLVDPLKTFDNKRIIEVTKYIYNKFSVRTAKEEVVAKKL